MSDFKLKVKNTKPVNQPKAPVQTKAPIQPKPTTKANPYVEHIERPSNKDYETGFSSKRSKTIDEKYPGYHQGSIDEYLKRLSQKMNDDFSWRIGSNADILNIYNKDDKLFVSKKLHHIAGDLYYAVFNEPDTEFVKAHKAIVFITWFI